MVSIVFVKEKLNRALQEHVSCMRMYGETGKIPRKKKLDSI